MTEHKFECGSCQQMKFGKAYLGAKIPVLTLQTSLCSKVWLFTDGTRMSLFTPLFPSFKGVLCPTGCELRTTLLKQEKSVKPVINDLKVKVNTLSEGSSTFYEYMTILEDKLVKRQKQRKGMLFLWTTSVNDIEVLLAFLQLLFSGISLKIKNTMEYLAKQDSVTAAS